MYYRVGEATDPGVLDHLQKVVPVEVKNKINGAVGKMRQENGLLLDIENGDTNDDVQEASTHQVQGICRCFCELFHCYNHKTANEIPCVSCIKILKLCFYNPYKIIVLYVG